MKSSIAGGIFFAYLIRWGTNVKRTRPLPTRPLEIAYPDHMIVRKVRASGQIWWKSKELFISETLAGEPIALEQLDVSTYKIHYGPIELALFDDKNRKIIKPKINWKKRR